MDNTAGSIRAKFIKHIDELLKLDEKAKEAIGFSTVMLVDARRDISLSMSDKELFALELGRALYKTPEANLEIPKTRMELRQIKEVRMILNYVLNEYPFLTLVPKVVGNSVTIPDSEDTKVDYRISFELSYGNSKIYHTVISINPKWVIRIRTVVVGDKFTGMTISSNFGKDFFGMESVEEEFNFKAYDERSKASDFIHAHLRYVKRAIRKANA